MSDPGVTGPASGAALGSGNVDSVTFRYYPLTPANGNTMDFAGMTLDGIVVPGAVGPLPGAARRNSAIASTPLRHRLPQPLAHSGNIADGQRRLVLPLCIGEPSR